MSFVVTAAGHSGTRLFSLQLGRAPGWWVEHEPDEYIGLYNVCRRFEKRSQEQGGKYGEVNSYLLRSIRHIPVDRKAILLRNPYDIVMSILPRSRKNESDASVVMYVREAIATLEALAIDNYDIIRFKDITADKDAVVRYASMLGVQGLSADEVRMPRINRHANSTTEPPTYSKETCDEFDRFIYEYNL